MDARPWALANHKIDAEVFHGRVKNFLESGEQAMNFVEEEEIVAFHGRENGGEVAFFLEQRTGTDFYGDAHLVGENLGEGGLAEPRGTVEQDVIESFAAGAGSLDGDLEIFFNARLTDVVGEMLRADARFEARIFIESAAGNEAM